LHAGKANLSANPRPILYNMYCRPWFRDSRNYRLQRPIQISRDEYFRIPEEFRSLFHGWRR